MQLTGAEIIVECLKEQGVDTVFGYPGGAILNVYDALYEYKDQITHVLTSHEQGASHAADGYARATGKVGVCLATSGPGATNLVTGIATAYMDSVPMVAITCNVGTPLLGKDSFQEVDITGIVMPITKHSFIVKDITTLADTVRRAFYIAKSGRPGPVLVDVTKDVTGAKYEYTACAPAEITPKTDTIKDEDIATAVQMIKEAKRPFIFTGGGTIISEASREVCELAKRITVPVSLDFMSVSSYGDDTKSSGVVKIVKDLDQPLEGKDVLIVEDIIDSGRTLSYLIEILKQRNPNSIRLCTLLDKPERRVRDVRVDYCCFNIPDEFVVGYGLDYAQKYRNLPFIGVVELGED